MGRIVLQMMISVDGMVSEPEGQLDWIARDEPLERDHLARLERAAAVMMGAGLYPGLPDYWEAAAHDERATATTRAVGRTMTAMPKLVYSHRDIPVKVNATLRRVADDKTFGEDVRRLKREREGTIVTYGGVRFARSLLRQDLVDEIHLDVCPLVLGAGHPLFTNLTHRTLLRLRESVTYDSGAVMMHYEVVSQ
jgi:dihydrofolate reductase